MTESEINPFCGHHLRFTCGDCGTCGLCHGCFANQETR